MALFVSTNARAALTTRRRRCPICGEGKNEILHSQCIVAPDDYPLPSGFDVVVCSTCGMVYNCSSATQTDYDKFYSTFSVHEAPVEASHGEIPVWEVSRLEGLARIVSNCAPSHGRRILDVGCSGGGLLKNLARSGYTNLVGIDPSPLCVANARSNGIEAYVGAAGNLPEDIGVFDLILLTGVLEHIQDLRGAMRSLVRASSPHGRIFLEVPDAGRYADFLHSPFQDFNTEHINHFSCDSLRNLMAPFGFTLIHEEHVTVIGASRLVYPCLGVTFERTSDQPLDIPWRKEETFRQSVERYIRGSHQMMIWLDQQLKERLPSSPEVIVWGTGQLAMKLLSDTMLKHVSVVAFVDGNQIYAGRRILGIPILRPEDIPNESAPIIIASLLHSAGILNKIKSLGLKNPIITLAAHQTGLQSS
jgi:SAM-dependent methyltransferase